MLKAGFILLSIILACTVFAGVSYAANKVYPEKNERNVLQIKAILLMVLWLSYVSVMSLNGVFLDPSLPPRIPLLLVLPFLIFIGYFFMSGRFKAIIEVIPLHWLIYVQTFRIAVELLLFGLFMVHMLPWAATYEGYNFDIGIGITAPFIGFLTLKGKLSRSAIRIWNFLGIFTLVVVVVILNTFAYRPWLFDQAGTILGKGFGTFPFTFLASFFMPLAIFMHIFALVKTGRTKS
jgi:hypothetical protein